MRALESLRLVEYDAIPSDFVIIKVSEIDSATLRVWGYYESEVDGSAYASGGEYLPITNYGGTE